jgi:type II secretory pathway pseudopilin PulG
MPIRRRIPVSQRYCRGFSLVESAIVFLIVGLIVGAIFSLTAPVEDQVRVNHAVDELGVISNNVRSYYSGQVLPSAASVSPLTPCPATAASLTPAAGPNIFPTEMVAGAVVNNPWNTASAASTAQVYLCEFTTAAPNYVAFVIHFTGLSAEDCGNLVVRSSLVAAGMNLTQIVVTPSVGAATIFNTQFGATTNVTGVTSGAVLPTNAAAACSGGAASVDWYYKLSG